MESVMERVGLHFLRETVLTDKQILPEDEQKTKICGVCEPNQTIIPLPVPLDIAWDPPNVRDVLDSRQSLRSYSGDELFRWEISLLLHYTQGVREQESSSHFRTVPSAGNLHPFETYLVINRVSGIEPGLYRYLPLDHALVQETCHSGNQQEIAKACKNQALVSSSALTFIWTAVPERMVWKFGSRGWRYLFIEAGHICQNLYVIGAGLNLGVCAIGSYQDDKMNCILGIDGETEFCIYMASIGRK